jgi:hypothetical protein
MKLFCVVAAIFAAGFSALAASFNADFNTGTVPAGSSLVGTATVQLTGGNTNSGGLRLTENVGGQVGAMLVNDFSSGAAIGAFSASFKVEIGPAAGADGFSFNWGTNLTGTGFIEEGDGTGLSVAFDTFDNGGAEAPAIDIKWLGNTIAHSAVPFNYSAAYAAFVPVQVTLTNGQVTVIWNAVPVHSNIGLVGFGSLSSAKFSLGGRTGGSAERHYIDDLSITTTAGSGSSSPFALRKALQTDSDANGKINPGDVLRYTISLTNTFGTNLLNTAITNPAAAMLNQTLVGGTITATPLARADAPATNSAPGSAFHAALNTTLTIPAASGLLTNDFLGLPAAQITSFGGGSFPGTVTTTAAGATANAPGIGALTVNADGSLTFVPTATFNGLATFQYRLANSVGTNDTAGTLAIGIRPNTANDAFNLTGNTMMDSTLIPLTLLANDAGNLIGVSANTAPAHGTVSVTTAGNLIYTPAAAYTGPDSFTYTLTNGFGPVIGTVNLNVANKIWYIDNSVAVSGDGRSTSPFKQTSDFTTVNDGAAGHPGDNDSVLLLQGTGNYTGSTTLRLGQKLIGDGAVGTFSGLFGFSLAPGSAKAAGVAVPALTGTRPFISVASGTGVTLNSGNTVRGLNVSAANGRAFSGASVGFLTISNVTASATGDRVLNLNSGSGVFATLDSASSTNSLDSGITLSALSGSTVIINGGFITGAAGTDFLVSGCNANIQYFGAINNTVGRSVDISGQTGGGVSLQGNITDSGTGMIAQNNTAGVIALAGASKIFSTGANTALTLTNNPGVNINFINGGLAVNTTSGTGMAITGGGSILVSSVANTITSTTGTTLLNSGTGGSATIDINAPLTGTGRLIDIQNRTSGNVTLSGNLTNNPGTGMLIQNNSGGGTITLSGTSKIFNTGANAAVSLVNNTGTTINFNNGGLAITTTSANGLSATGGGTVSVPGSVNTIDATTGTGLNVANTTIGASGLNFQRISAPGSSGSAGIVLDNTGSSGGLTVTGTGAAASGGTIANKTGADILSGSTVTGNTASGTTGTGIFLRNTSGASFSNMQINDTANFAIYGNNITGFSLSNSVVSGVNGNNNAGDREESALRFDNLFTSVSFPSARIAGCTIGGGAFGNLAVWNVSGTLNRLVLTNTTFGLISATIGNDNVDVTSYNSAVCNVTLTECNFSGTRADFFEAIANNNSTMDVVARRNLFTSGQAIIPGGGVGVSIRGDTVGAACTMTYDVSCNRIVGAVSPNQANAYDTVAIFVAKGKGNGTFNGDIYNNVIGPARTSPTLANADGIFVRSAGTSTNTVLIQNNVLSGYGNVGIHIQNNDGSCTVNATIYTNSLSSPNSQNFAGIFVDNGATATDTCKANVVIGSATDLTKQNSLVGSGLGIDVSLSSFNAANPLNLFKNGSASGTTAAVIADDNTGSPSVDTTGGVGPIILTTTPVVAPATPSACTPR